MDSKASCILFLALFSLISSSCAFNITKILSSYSDFSSFNDLLTQTELAQQINSRQTITVLVVSNGAVGSVAGKPVDIAKRILSAHVILDYYDSLKLSKLDKKSSILTTLYQTTGIADDQQGFLNVTKTPNGIMFGSAMKGAPLTSSLVGTVTTQPYNISVLQVSSVIETPGIESMSPPPPPGAAAAPKKAPAPPPATPSEAPAPEANGGDDATPSEAPSEATSEAPGPAEADSPASSPPEPHESEAAEPVPASAPESSGSSRVVAGGLAVVGLVATVLGF